MSSLPQLLLTYGPLGILVILMLVPAPGADSPFLVGYWYIKKQNEESKLKDKTIEGLQEANDKLLQEREASIHVVAELRAIVMNAMPRSGGGMGEGPPSIQGR
jgi:hypothetical protein